MTWVKRLAVYIRIVFLKADVNNDLRSLTLQLEAEVTKLKNIIVDQTELVLQYKEAMGQMREHMMQMMHMEMNHHQNGEENEEEEGFIDPYELLKKKTTIH